MVDAIMADWGSMRCALVDYVRFIPVTYKPGVESDQQPATGESSLGRKRRSALQTKKPRLEGGS